MNYSLTYGRNVQMFWAMVLPAFVAIVPLMVAVELTTKYYPENNWLTILITILYMVVVIASTFVWIRSIQKEVVVTLKDAEIHIQFQRKNIFHPSDIHLPINQIRNTSIQNDKGYDFLYIETNRSHVKNFYLRSKEMDPDLFSLYEAINQHSEKTHPRDDVDPKVSHLNFYKKWPMKVIGWMILILLVTIPVYMFLNHLNPFASSKLWIFIITGSPIIFKVFIQNSEST